MTNHRVQSAIDDSVRMNRIVTLEEPLDSPEWVALAAALDAACDNSVEMSSAIGEITEYWGVDDDGDEWRVHLHGTRSAVPEWVAADEAREHVEHLERSPADQKQRRMSR